MYMVFVKSWLWSLSVTWTMSELMANNNFSSPRDRKRWRSRSLGSSVYIPLYGLGISYSIPLNWTHSRFVIYRVIIRKNLKKNMSYRVDNTGLVVDYALYTTHDWVWPGHAKIKVKRFFSQVHDLYLVIINVNEQIWWLTSNGVACGVKEKKRKERNVSGATAATYFLRLNRLPFCLLTSINSVMLDNY